VDGLLVPQDSNTLLMQAAREAVRAGPQQVLDLGTGDIRWSRR
jgi:methylase of polypeptide subunit release factors